LLIGGGIGAIIALLFAPKSGQELREDIADATRKGLEKGRETAAHLQEKAGEYYEVSREKGGELIQTAQEKGGELAERGKTAAGCTTHP
ncbi:YtxH domain-containing protein, partial [Vibrio parahaemolyticus]|uniref:YtxH domain-containing protein n=1 Tax=Vibrio parahaemolyticus TaxID=670 RepID=UPI001A8DF714